MMTVTGKKTVKMMRNMKSSGEKRSVWEMLDRVDKTFISVQGRRRSATEEPGWWDDELVCCVGLMRCAPIPPSQYDNTP